MKEKKPTQPAPDGPAIALSEKLLRAVLDNSPENIILLDKNYRILCFNQVIKNTLLSVTGKEIHVGDDYRDYSTSSLKELFFEAFEKALRGETTELEAETIFKNRSTWYRHTLTPVYEPGGALLGVSFVAVDIDKHKKAELELKQSEEKFRKITEAAACPILIVNRDMKIMLANPEAERVFGYTAAEVIGRGIDILIPERFRVAHKQHEQDFLGNPGPRHQGKGGNISALKKNGEELIIEAKLNHLEIDNETFILVIIQDITHQIHAAQSLEKYNHELTLLNTINDTILVADSEEDLYNRVVKSIVEVGSYRLAWIGHKPASAGTDQVVKPVAAAGQTSYLEHISIDLSDSKTSKGPTAQTLLKRRTTITNDIHAVNYFKPWIEQAGRFGIAASIVLPLNTDDPERPGALSIYSGNINAFDENEVMVLERLANNVSLAVRGIRTRKEKDEARYFLKERIKELGTIYHVSSILQDEGNSEQEVFEKIVKILPMGWQFPEICETKIEFNGESYTTPGYKPSAYSQRADIQTQDGKKGFIEVVYTEERPPDYEGPFFKEERDLINTLAEMVEVYFNKAAHQKALMQSEANLKSIFDNTDVGHLLLDTNYSIIAYNLRFQTGYAILSGIEIKLNTNFIDLLLPEKKDFVASVFEQVEANKNPFEYETSYVHNHETHYFSISIAPVYDNNRHIGFCMSAYDVTKRKRLELERQNIIHDLMQRNRDLEQFAYIVSHNLRAPVANIIGFSSMLGEGVFELGNESVVKGIERSAESLDSVIRDLNMILQARREITELKKPVKFDELVKKIMKSISRVITESKVVIETDFSAVSEMTSIPSYLESIFFNLISNAIKYADPQREPHLRIYTEQTNDCISIHFKDNGIGINLQKYSGQLFGLYKRFHPHIEGKGLGLFMVKTQTEVLGGNIHVESSPGEGTEFILTFKEA